MIMKRISKYIQSRKYVIFFSIVYFLIRLIRLDSYFLLKDERDLILTVLSIAQRGVDLYGHSFPFIFLRISPQTPFLGMYWTVPIISFLHITAPLFVKMLYLFPTLFFPLLVFEFILSIIKERKISFLASFVISFSPWYFHTGRLGVEAHLAYFFCLLGLILYTSKKKIVGVFFLLLSYFSYFGIRPFIFVVVPYIELWTYIFSSKKEWKKTIVSLMVFIILFGCVFVLCSKVEHTSSRSSAEVILLNKNQLTSETNFLREISDAPFFVRKYFDNKPSIALHSIFYNFFKGIDASYLFFTGDYVAIYANQITGQFFPFLFVFFILGICFLAKKKNGKYYFVAGLSVVGLVSSLINSYSLTFSIRSVFSLVGIGFVCALGIVYAYELCNKKWRSIFIVSMIFLFFFFSVIFAYKYLFQNYKMTNSLFNEQERYMARYMRNNNVQTIVVPNIHSYFLSYLVTFPSLSASLFQRAQNELNKPDILYTFDGHRFSQCPTKKINFISTDAFPFSTIIDESCLSVETKQLINRYKSEGVVKLIDTEYKSGDINRGIKYYFFK